MPIYAHDHFRPCPKPERTGPKKPQSIAPVSARRLEAHGTGEYDLFLQIAAERPHVCYVTNRLVNVWKIENGVKVLNVDVFAHVISKGARPDLRLLKNNIQIMLPEIHAIYDRGNKWQRQDMEKYEGWRKLHELKEEILSENQTNKVVRA